MEDRNPAAALTGVQLPEQELNLQCPRCDSTDTKFCYYNNYNLSQPRYFCKGCRRYWTKGGALRNVPVGGATRKTSKRSSSSSSAPNNSKRSNPHKPSTSPPPSDLLMEPEEPVFPLPFQPTDFEHRLFDFTGSFSSLLSASNSLIMSSNDSKDSAKHKEDQETAAAAEEAEEAEDFLGLQVNSEYWSGYWTDLAIYNNPGSSFH